MMIALLALSFIVALSLINVANAEKYVFNMTKELLDEEAALTFCMNTDIYMEYCETIYGSIDKPYGEAIK